MGYGKVAYIVIRRIRHADGSQLETVLDVAFTDRNAAIRYVESMNVPALHDAAKVLDVAFAHEIRELPIMD
jgi:hypothetical protein